MEISAAILAGGRAARLGGADKASLLIGGRRIIDHQLALLTAVSEDVQVVTNDEARYPDLGVRIVADAIAGAGPLGGVYTALIGARHDRVLVLACDLPFVSAALIAQLVAASAGGAVDDIDAVVPRSARGPEPLCAVYRTRCADVARACIERGELRMTAWLAEVRVREIEASAFAPHGEGALFENVNTPHDYARAKGRVALDEKPSEDPITE